MTISLDNQPVIRAVNLRRRGHPGQHLISSIREGVARLLRHLPRDADLSIRWISGHDDNELNEFTDELAKGAAQGASSDRAELRGSTIPHRVAHSLSAVVQQYNSRLRLRWTDEWMASERYPRYAESAPTAYVPSLLKSLEDLSRHRSSVIFQLITGHSALNAHLCRLKLVESAMCATCDAAIENTQHFVFHCPTYAAARETLRDAMGRDWPTTIYGFATAKGMKRLGQYVKDTGRFGRGWRPSDELRDASDETMRERDTGTRGGRGKQTTLTGWLGSG